MSDINDPLNPSGTPSGVPSGPPGEPPSRHGAPSESPAFGQASASAPNPEPEPAPQPSPPPQPDPVSEPKEEPKIEAEEEKKLREPFPFLRLLFTILYGFLASLVFWIVILLAGLQFITIAISGEKNAELDQFNRRIARYMQEMFDYMMLSSDKRPFPLGPFPAE